MNTCGLINALFYWWLLLRFLFIYFSAPPLFGASCFHTACVLLVNSKYNRNGTTKVDGCQSIEIYLQIDNIKWRFSVSIGSYDVRLCPNRCHLNRSCSFAYRNESIFSCKSDWMVLLKCTASIEQKHQSHNGNHKNTGGTIGCGYFRIEYYFPLFVGVAVEKQNRTYRTTLFLATRSYMARRCLQTISYFHFIFFLFLSCSRNFGFAFVTMKANEKKEIKREQKPTGVALIARWSTSHHNQRPALMVTLNVESDVKNNKKIERFKRLFKVQLAEKNKIENDVVNWTKKMKINNRLERIVTYFGIAHVWDIYMCLYGDLWLFVCTLTHFYWPSVNEEKF